MASRLVVILVVAAGLLVPNVQTDKPMKAVNKFIFTNMTSWFSSACIDNILGVYTSYTCTNKSLSDFGSNCVNVVINYVTPKLLSLLTPMNCVQSATGSSIITAIEHLMAGLLDLGAPIYNRSTQACLTTLARQANKTARLNPATRSARVLRRKICHVPFVQRVFSRWCTYASTPTELNAMRQCLPTFYQWSLYNTNCAS